VLLIFSVKMSGSVVLYTQNLNTVK